MTTRKRRFKGGGRRFIQLYTNVKRSEAYHSLGVYARSALFELLDRYTGINNGMIGLGCRELSDALNCSRDRAAKALIELDDAGLAHPLTYGLWRGKKASEWRLTFYRCDKTGELPTLNWVSRSQSARKDAKVRVVGRKAVLSPCARTQEPKNPMIGISLSPSGRTHIDIHQGDRDAVSGAEGAPPDLTAEPLEHFSPNFALPDDPRIASLTKWGASVVKKAWTKPTIIADEPRDFAEFPLDQELAA